MKQNKQVEIQEIEEGIIWEKYLFRAIVSLFILIIICEIKLVGGFEGMNNLFIFLSYALVFYTFLNLLRSIGFFTPESKINKLRNQK